jgi:hypothetical protein
MKVSVVCDDPSVRIDGDHDPAALDLVAHMLGMVEHQNLNAPPARDSVVRDRADKGYGFSHAVDVTVIWPQPANDSAPIGPKNVYALKPPPLRSSVAWNWEDGYKSTRSAKGSLTGWHLDKSLMVI